jgi:hypothetical protein
MILAQEAAEQARQNAAQIAEETRRKQILKKTNFAVRDDIGVLELRM